MQWMRRTKYGRWILAGVIASVGAGAFGVVQMTSAAPNNSPAALVPITPCRLFDTRPGGDNVGLRSTPIGENESWATQVTGTNGNCSIPTTATAVALNITFVNPSANSVLTVYPADADLPKASNLNWVKGQAPSPNAVTVALSASGALRFWNLFGTVDVIADIAGYYQPGGIGTPGPKGDKGDPGTPGGPIGPQGPSGATRASARVSKTLSVYPGSAGVVSSGVIVKQGHSGDGSICVQLTFSPAQAVVVASADNDGDDTHLNLGQYTQVESNANATQVAAECDAGNWILFVTGRINASSNPVSFQQTNEPFYFIVS